VDESDRLDEGEVKRIQQIIGVLLYYTRAVDPSMLTAVARVACMQSQATVNVKKATDRLLLYAAKWPEAAITYKPSNMQLIGYSDASHGAEPGARSRAGGILYLGSKDQLDIINGSVLCISTVVNVLCPSAAEAEYAALFIVGSEAASIRNTLADLGYQQSATPIFCDNSCAVGIANDGVKQKRSRAMDLRFHWIRDRVRQGQFQVLWKAGQTNLADFFTKPLGPQRHLLLRRFIVCYPTRKRSNNRVDISTDVLRGCDDVSSLVRQDIE
jgi:hypothetical protein